MSDCAHPSHRNPTGTRRCSFSEENRAPFICPLWRKQLFKDGNLVGSRCQRRYFSGTPLGTVQHLSCSSAKCTSSTWPSAIHCCTAHANRWLTKQEVHGPGEGKCTHVSLWYASLFGMCHSALLSTTGDFCITFFELPCLCHWTVSFSAHRALGGSIFNDLTIMHLPLKISTLAASKECPGDGNTASSKGRSCHQKGNGVARCSAWVRWRHVLRTTTATTEQISVWSMHPNFFSVGIMAKGIWRGMILPSGSSRMKLGINDMLKPKPPPFFLLFNFCHRLFL